MIFAHQVRIITCDQRCDDHTLTKNTFAYICYRHFCSRMSKQATLDHYYLDFVPQLYQNVEKQVKIFMLAMQRLRNVAANVLVSGHVRSVMVRQPKAK